MEFISLSDFYHLDVFSAIPADRTTYSVQKSWLINVLKNHISKYNKPPTYPVVIWFSL